MKKKVLVLPLSLLILFSLLPASSFAETNSSVTIETAVNEGLGLSPKVKMSEALVGETSWGRLESFSGFLPKLSVSANHFFDNTFQYLTISGIGPAPISFGFVYPYSTLNVDASITLFDGFETYNKYRGSRLTHEAANLESSYTKLQVEEDVRLKFYQALAAQALAVVADQNLKTLEDHLEKVQTQTRVGTATKFDLLRVEVQMNDARSDRIASQDSVVLTKIKLAEAMGKEVENRELSGELPIPDPELVKSVVPEKTHRQDIEAKLLQVEAAQYRKSASKGFWFPKLSFMTEYQLYDNVDRNWDNVAQSYHNDYFVGASLSWNIFDGAASLARSQEAIYQAKEAEAAARMAQLQVPQDIETWKRKYTLSSQVYIAKKSDVEKAEESVRLATLGLKAGTRTSTEVLDAELDLFRARAGVVRAQADAAEAKINLELAIGQRI